MLDYALEDMPDDELIDIITVALALKQAYAHLMFREDYFGPKVNTFIKRARNNENNENNENNKIKYKVVKGISYAMLDSNLEATFLYFLKQRHRYPETLL